MKKPPTAPPAYRPQPVPLVLQAKTAPVKTPPVYRPQPTPLVAQRKELKHGPKATIQAKAAGRIHPANARPALPRAVAQPKVARPAPALPARAIQRQKSDAQTYSDTNGLGITANHSTVTAYVTNPLNPKDKRKGLLDAWNLNNARWAIDTPADLSSNTASTYPYSYANFSTYKDWTNTTSGVSFTTPFGTGNVSAYHSRGAPKLGSNAKDWGKTTLGDTYVEYVRGLRSGGLSDPQIATAMLTDNDSAFKSQLEKRAAAMLWATVYLAEEWRKQGAAKIFRAMLRAIEAGTKDFDDFKIDFAFIPSAQGGRQMVGRFYDVFNNDIDVTDLSGAEQTYYNCLSPGPSDDFSSDDEMRTDDKKNLKGTRLFAEKHSSK
ncbi:MAG TPA: hypothetical protein VHH35_18130 [Pyrinomonadaceae bacterium]|nr:hypothetical protein [Pyrinomonadaceae bacterium]